MSRLTEFDRWRCSSKSRIEGHGYCVSFFDSAPSINKSMRLDFKSNRVEATIVAWECGEIVPEAYDSVNDRFIIVDRIEERGRSVSDICNTYLEEILNEEFKGNAKKGTE